MLDVAPAGLLLVNRGADANIHDDLLTFISNAILKNGSDIFGMRKPSKFNIPWCIPWYGARYMQEGSEMSRTHLILYSWFYSLINM